MKNKKTGNILISIGGVLIISALLLSLYNYCDSRRAGKEAEKALDELQTQLVQETEKSENDSETEQQAPAEMKETEIEGYSYIGYLSIPSLELELPVMAQWDYARLKIAPCRQYGTVQGKDLVIAAHNYERHFGKIGSLEIGNIIRFTDMDGIVTSYEVKKVDTLSPYSVDEVKNSEWDIVLYTCTPGGKSRVTVGAEMLNDKAEN